MKLNDLPPSGESRGTAIPDAMIDGPSPSGLTVRKLEIDLAGGFGRHWHGGDAFRTQFHNALSMSFPVGEQAFIDSVRDAVKLLPPTADHALMQETVQQFAGQEATHRHIHGLYNAHLDRQGLVNTWQHRAAARLARAKAMKMDPRHLLAITAAYEHLTAVLAEHVLLRDRTLDDAEAAMRTLWRWHAAEETEHRAVAFDLYAAVGGNYRWRMRWYLYVLAIFSIDAARQTSRNLWHDGTLFRPSTWLSGLRFVWGRDGLAWSCGQALLAYFRRDFHPDEETRALPGHASMAAARRWLRENAKSFRVVR